MLTENDLLKKKKEIEAAKTEVAELQGEENSLLKSLKEKYGCKNLDEAKIKINKYKKDIDTLAEEIESLTEEIEDEYFTDDED